MSNPQTEPQIAPELIREIAGVLVRAWTENEIPYSIRKPVEEEIVKAVVANGVAGEIGAAVAEELRKRSPEIVQELSKAMAKQLLHGAWGVADKCMEAFRAALKGAK